MQIYPANGRAYFSQDYFANYLINANYVLRVCRVSLEITEKGAHAAAATATGIERFGEIGEFFEINRPFVFFIWDYVSGALLFIGRVADPKPLAVP